MILVPTADDGKTSSPNTAPFHRDPPRKMTITVAIPQTHIVHRASLVLTLPEESSSQGTTVAVVGRPLMAELRIKHTRRWSSPTSLMSAADISSPVHSIDFVYTLEANPEAWLIAGQRRAHFAAKEDEEHKFPVMLIPLRTGTMLLPNVEIRAKVPPKVDEKRGSTAGQADPVVEDEQLNCETDYLNYGESVIAVPDVRSSTVGIGELGAPMRTVWLEAEGR